MGRFLQLATFHEGFFFLAAYTNVAKGNKLHIEDLVRAVGVGVGGGGAEGQVPAQFSADQVLNPISNRDGLDYAQHSTICPPPTSY